MAKRSDFKRIERDYYRTFDPKAGRALEPFIEGIEYYAEPFAGRGDLIENLRNAGVKAECDFACDIEPQDIHINQYDAFNLELNDLQEVDAIITNPPWSRPILHKIIDKFAPMVQTWMLIDANWLFTKQASPYINKYLTDVVTIGRLKWIEGTTMSGKDDCIWTRFSVDKSEPTRFFGRE